MHLQRAHEIALSDSVDDALKASVFKTLAMFSIRITSSERDHFLTTAQSIYRTLGRKRQLALSLADDATRDDLAAECTVSRIAKLEEAANLFRQVGAIQSEKRCRVIASELRESQDGG